MASRTLHLAAAKLILENTIISDENRFTLGMILPDMYDVEKKARNNTHLILFTGDGRKTCDLKKYRDLFGGEMMNDPLYLGYYLHLVQDLVYHYSMNEIYNFSPKIKGNVEKLHNDYRLINRYVIDKYKLKNSVRLPENFESEKLHEVFFLDTGTLYSELEEDFASAGEGKTAFFTEKMADDFVAQSVGLCLDEISALKNGRSSLDGNKYLWHS